MQVFLHFTLYYVPPFTSFFFPLFTPTALHPPFTAPNFTPLFALSYLSPYFFSVCPFKGLPDSIFVFLSNAFPPFFFYHFNIMSIYIPLIPEQSSVRKVLLCFTLFHFQFFSPPCLQICLFQCYAVRITTVCIWLTLCAGLRQSVWDLWSPLCCDSCPQIPILSSATPMFSVT